MSLRYNSRYSGGRPLLLGGAGGGGGRGNGKGNGGGNGNNGNNGGSGGINPGSDPFFSSVKLLLHMDGTNGQTTFTDSSPVARAISRSGTAVVTTADKKFGTGSLSLAGTGNDYLQAAASADFSFGTGDWTIEAWIKPATIGAGFDAIVGNFNNLNNGSCGLTRNGSAVAFYGKTTTGLDLYIQGGTLTTSAWYHVAAARVGTTIYLFLDGVLQASRGSLVGDIGNSAIAYNVGITGGLIDNMQGLFDEVRVTKGVGRYSSNFTPPTAAFPNF